MLYEAYCHGFDAGQWDQSTYDNPYHSRTLLFRMWNLGWLDGQEKQF